MNILAIDIGTAALEAGMRGPDSTVALNESEGWLELETLRAAVDKAKQEGPQSEKITVYVPHDASIEAYHALLGRADMNVVIGVDPVESGADVTAVSLMTGGLGYLDTFRLIRTDLPELMPWTLAVPALAPAPIYRATSRRRTKAKRVKSARKARKAGRK